MATNETKVVTSHNVLNYGGMLFNKGNVRTPFSTLIGGKSKTTNSWKFVLGQEYTTTGGESQPAITETASLTAPDPSFITRTPKDNCVQIFHETVSVSYGKQASMGQLSGLNIEGQKANPSNELDFQTAAKMVKIANDIEYTFLNGSYQDGNYDDVAYKTRGILTAIQTNAVAADSAALGYWLVAEVIRAIAASQGDTSNLVLMTPAVNIMQLNADATANGLSVIPASREVNGIKISTLLTPFGDVGIIANESVASGTALIFNPAVCAPVYMPVPGKGNFFRELLGKEGAADTYQIYGHAGLDYGMEWMHGKITGLSTSFSAPTTTRSVYVVSSADSPVYTQAVTPDAGGSDDAGGGAGGSDVSGG